MMRKSKNWTSIPLNEQKICRQRKVNSITIKKKNFEGDLTVIAACGDPFGCTAK